jgi:protein-S-isoprenylcysteine O-methyltransferase Ste14
VLLRPLLADTSWWRENRRAYRVEMADAPAYRIWPPVALGVPMLAGLGLTTGVGDPIALPAEIARNVAVVLLVAFALWNGWALWLMARSDTAVLPGGSTSTILDRGPFAVSRNPLYLGLIALDVALALLWPSFWGLASVPVGVVALWWGAILPEERYLSGKFGAEYDGYRARVRRWL